MPYGQYTHTGQRMANTGQGFGGHSLTPRGKQGFLASKAPPGLMRQGHSGQSAYHSGQSAYQYSQSPSPTGNYSPRTTSPISPISPQPNGFRNPYAGAHLTPQQIANIRRLEASQARMTRRSAGGRIPVDAAARHAPWYLGGLPRHELKGIAVDILKNGVNGEFFVRDVSSQPNCLGLSIKIADMELTNFLLLPTNYKGRDGVTLRGTHEVFGSLSELIKHYAYRHRPSLPCQLILSERTRGSDVISELELDHKDIYGMMKVAPHPTQHTSPQAPTPAPVPAPVPAPAPAPVPVQPPIPTPQPMEFASARAALELVKKTENEMKKQREDTIKLIEQLQEEKKRTEELESERNGLAKQVADIYTDVQNVRQEVEASKALSQLPTVTGLDDVTSRKQARHRAAIEGRKAVALARQARMLEKRISRGVSPDEQRVLDQLERARGSDVGTTPGGGFSRNVPGLFASHDMLSDPGAMWNVISSSDAPKDEKLAAARAQLAYLQQEEKLALEKLKQAQAIVRSRKFSEDDTVFDDDFENATIMDEETGETFGFGGVLGRVEEEESYGFDE
eukprot:m.33040 g.33040  ORF g.33040 m.33040 type:complete len:564 (+) comp8482_c0_seq1:305-1996(+)